jgi:hypothetical protein
MGPRSFLGRFRWLPTGRVLERLSLIRPAGSLIALSANGGAALGPTQARPGAPVVSAGVASWASGPAR